MAKASSLPDGILDDSRARQVFEALLASPLFGEWNHLGGGCEVRAEVASRLMARKRMFTMKAWVFPYLKEDGTEPFALAPARQDPLRVERFFIWGYHVAPAALIRSADGGLAFKVFDPALIDGPCTPARWLAALSAVNGRLMFTERNIYLISPQTGCRFVNAPSDADMRQELRRMAAAPDTDMPRLAAEGETSG